MTIPTELLKSLGEGFQTSASVKNVFGEPITVGDRTVVPVACIGYGFGAGGGEGKRDQNGESRPLHGGGGGGGGGIGVQPIGVIEITPTETRFLHFTGRKRMAAAMMLGFFLGTIFGWRRSRR